jgi:hypothetical protein
MSTVTKIVERPVDAPKAPIYPRLVCWNDDKTIVAWALRESEYTNRDFFGVIVAKGDSLWEVGETSEGLTKALWVDFSGAVTLYNK